MAKGIKDNVQRLTNPKLPRIIGGIRRSLEFSSPALSRPKVFWMEGINPGIVREHWPTQGELPYRKCKLPPRISSMIPGAPTRGKCYNLGITKKMVVYDRTHPEIRLVLLLDAPYDCEGETWQPIVQSRVERDSGVDPRQSRPREERLWDEVCRVERRGRPRGTGHPKKQVLQRLSIPLEKIDRLRRAGFDDKDLRILFGRWENKTLRLIGQELGISPQAVWKRWKRRIEPGIKRVNPSFSSASFKVISLASK